MEMTRALGLRRRLTTIVIAALTLILLGAGARAAVLRTTDGLALELTEDGRIAGLQADGKPVPVTVGGGAWLADVAATVPAAGQPADAAARRYLRTPLQRRQGVLVQETTWQEDGLQSRAAYTSTGDCISVELAVTDTTGRDRAVEVAWELPLQTAGWVWADDLRQRRTVELGAAYRSVYACPAGPGFSQVYPFISLAKGPLGLSVAALMSQGPRVYSMEVDGPTGNLLVRCHLGLSAAVRSHPSSGSFAFLLYRHDGNWGLRAAADRYYRLFPTAYEKRVPYEGYLGYGGAETRGLRGGPEALYGLPARGDFGQGFRWLWGQPPTGASGDPDLSQEVQASLQRAVAELDRDAPDREPYAWCISDDAIGSVGQRLDFEPEHLADSAAPLTYDQTTRRPAVADLTWDWNSRVLGPLSRKHKLLLLRGLTRGPLDAGANTPYFDLGLIEYGAASRPTDEKSDLYGRTSAYRRIVRYRCAEPRALATEAAVRQMLSRGLVYAIYPDLPPDPERYRALYLRFVPVIEQLSAAGWEPVTLAWATDPGLRVERYGNLAARTLTFACRNVTDRPLTARVKLSPSLGLPTAAGQVVALDLLRRREAPVEVTGGQIALTVTLGSGESTAYSVLPPGERLRADLLAAAAALRQAAPLDMTDEASYETSRPATLSSDGEPAVRPEGVLCDGWCESRGLVWPAGDPVDVTLDLNSPHRAARLRVWYGAGDAAAAPACAIEGRDRDGNWQPLGALPAATADASSPSVALAVGAEYQFIRLRYPALGGPLRITEIEVTGLDGAMLRAADRLEALVAAAGPSDFGLVSQLALALRVRRMLGHDRTLQDRALSSLAAYCSRASGVEVTLSLSQPILAGVATSASLTVRNRGTVAFREGNLKLRLPPGWGAAPSQFQVDVPAGKTAVLEANVAPAAGAAAPGVLVTGMVGEAPLFLNVLTPVVAEAPLTARLESPFLPPGPGEATLPLLLHSRMPEPVLVTVALTTADGRALGSSMEVRTEPRTDVPVALPCPIAPDTAPGPMTLGLTMTFGATTIHAPLEVILTPRQAECAMSLTPLVVDGALSEAIWQRPPVITSLALASGAPASHVTTLRASWDRRRLYLAIECPGANPGAPAVTDRDGPVWQDDAVAVTLTCGGAAHRLAVNALGTACDARDGEVGWNGDWEAVTSRSAGGWTTEMAIPWATLCWQPRRGLTLGLNVERYDPPGGETSAWVTGDPVDGFRLGALVLRGQ